ncbi:MAG: aminotransferase class V-fold PLP-dependent enzyme [Erysipelotrichia bacterium]|nr:aminotransferase class V-fold PLP-dependent enzyme [Erysipelotrichia bacterium]
MNVYPLKSISIEEAMQKQFELVDCITKQFSGSESLSRGDLGVNKENNQPLTTGKVELVLKDFFQTEDAILVRGAGTNAIRYGISSVIHPGGKLLVHDAPIYSTTKTTIDMFGLTSVAADYNHLESIEGKLKQNQDIKAALVQYTRQKLDDSYDLEEVVHAIKAVSDIPVITDDNYAVLKVSKIGVQCGADLSCFSTFKLQGPEGIGCVVGKKKYIDIIRKMHYSGGCQVQGHEALDVLRGLVTAPVANAIQAVESEKIVEAIKNHTIKGIKNAYIANSQSKVIMVEFEHPIAQKVLKEAEKLGALPNPVGSESKYEIAPLFYRVSGTVLKTNSAYLDTMIRINPNRAGSQTVLNILTGSICSAEGDE